ncbi:MAG: hypothetical protein WCK51_08730 [Armatimonadota bacterium]
MKTWWPFSDRTVKVIILTGSTVGCTGGFLYLLGVMSLNYDRLNNSAVAFLVLTVIGLLCTFVPFSSCMIRLTRLRKGGASKEGLKPLRKLGMLTLLPFYIPHVFLMASGLWFETTGKDRLEQLNKQASYEYKQRLLARKAARDRANKVPPLDKGGR